MTDTSRPRGIRVSLLRLHRCGLVSEPLPVLPCPLIPLRRPILRKRPVRRGLTNRTTEVQPRLPVRPRRVERHTGVIGLHRIGTHRRALAVLLLLLVLLGVLLVLLVMAGVLLMVPLVLMLVHMLARVHVTMLRRSLSVSTMSAVSAHPIPMPTVPLTIVPAKRPALGAVHFSKRVEVLQLRTTQMTLISTLVAAPSAWTTTAATTTSTAVARVPKGRVFPRKLGLDTLAVWRVADRRENGANAFDKQHALRHFAVVENGLNDIVAVRVAEELFESRPVENLGHEHFADFGIGHTDALFHDV